MCLYTIVQPRIFDILCDSQTKQFRDPCTREKIKTQNVTPSTQL